MMVSEPLSCNAETDISNIINTLNMFDLLILFILMLFFLTLSPYTPKPPFGSSGQPKGGFLYNQILTYLFLRDSLCHPE